MIRKLVLHFFLYLFLRLLIRDAQQTILYLENVPIVD